MIYLVAATVAALLCGASARICCDRKNRSGLWSYATFIFPPFFLILFILPVKRPKWLPDTHGSEPEQPKLIKCKVCGGAMSSMASACPHCGNKNSIPKTGPGISEFIGLALSLAWFSLAGYIIYMRGVDGYLQGSDFPACDSRQAKKDAADTFASIPLFHMTGVKIISWKSIEQKASTERNLSCHAKVLLSSGSESGLDYTYSRENDDIIIRVSVSD